MKNGGPILALNLGDGAGFVLFARAQGPESLYARAARIGQNIAWAQRCAGLCRIQLLDSIVRALQRYG